MCASVHAASLRRGQCTLAVPLAAPRCLVVGAKVVQLIAHVALTSLSCRSHAALMPLMSLVARVARRLIAVRSPARVCVSAAAVAAAMMMMIMQMINRTARTYFHSYHFVQARERERERAPFDQSPVCVSGERICLSFLAEEKQTRTQEQPAVVLLFLSRSCQCRFLSGGDAFRLADRTKHRALRLKEF